DDDGVFAVVRVARRDDAVGQRLRLCTGLFERQFRQFGGRGIRHRVSLGAPTDSGSGLVRHALTGTADTVRSIVNCPITRVPSYITAVWPGATPSNGCSGRTVTTPSAMTACAGTGSAC